jgi:hypothetical protein
VAIGTLDAVLLAGTEPGELEGIAEFAALLVVDESFL